MDKQQFLESLRKKLSALPESDVEESLSFYIEMIDDLTEEGLDEDQAVARVGSVENIAVQIIAAASTSKGEKSEEKAEFKAEKKAEKKAAKQEQKSAPQKGLSAWEIVLLVLGSPIWLSLLIAFLAVVISMYAVLWAAIAAVWAIFASFCACAPAGIAAGVIVICGGHVATGIALIGAALVCAGFAIFAFMGSLWATRGTVWLTVKVFVFFKNLFRNHVFGKEVAR